MSGFSDVRVATVALRTGDGVSLYGAEVGSGDRGVLLANDVPHAFCEDLPPALLLARRGYHVLVFDYRGHGESADAGGQPGRLDLDVAAAVADLRDRGATRVALLGSYAGAAACVVAAVRITPPVDAVVGFSPPVRRGQYVEGPFDPEGQLAAAPRLRMPTLYATATTDRFVSLADVRRLYEATGARRKDLVTVTEGPGGWYLLRYNGVVRRAVLRFLAANL